MKKALKIIAIVLGVHAAIPLIAILVVFILIQVFHEPPEITYGEFAIEVTYEKDGEIITSNEIYVCEYAGFEPNTGDGWIGYVKGTDEPGILLYSGDNAKIFCRIGNPYYYMAGQSSKVSMYLTLEQEKKTWLWFKETTTEQLTEEELHERFNIKIIDWKATESIKR